MTKSPLSKLPRLKRSIFLLCFLFSVQPFLSAQCGNLYIAGAIDGPLAGGQPKAMQLCASASIADLSIYGIESVSNGGGSANTPEYNFPPDALNAGDCIWISGNFDDFNSFFGFEACFASGVIGSNGDDAYLLYCSGTLEDALGEPDTDGTGQCWDYVDGWIINNTMTPNGGAFDCVNYTMSGTGVLSGESTNAGSTTPYPNTTINCPAQACSISNVTVSTQGFCSGDDVMFTICADVVGGSGDYNIVDVSLGIVASGTGGTIGQVCITGNITGPTVVSTIDLDFADASGNTCIGGSPVTVNIPECPVINNCPMAFISEFAYDCDIDDNNEMIEVCVPNSFTGNLSDLVVEIYNGGNDMVYGTFIVGVDLLVGTDDGTNTYYSISNPSPSIQNGDPDGIALSFQGVNCEFISYEGTITAADGSATGMTSTDIGVGQTNSTTCDMSLQLCNGSWVEGTISAGNANSCPTVMCPDLSGAAPTPTIVNSTCATGETTPTGGSITAPSPTCPTGSTLEYAVNGSAFSSNLPQYNQAGPAQVIVTRCICNSDPNIISDTEGLITTTPGTCAGPGCDAAITTFPANGN